MNKAVKVLLVLISLLISVGLIVFDNTSYAYYGAEKVYRVYLNGQSLGLIKDKAEFESFINKEQESIKRRYGVENVYIPNGLKIEEETTYSEKVSKVEDIYNKIKDEEDFTIMGYTITIADKIEKKEKENVVETEKIKEYIYVLDNAIIEDSINNVVRSFVNEKQYNDYLNEVKKDTTAVGTIIENVYIKEQISIKKERIPANQKIYTTVQELSKYLLFGTNEKNKTYKVKSGDTVSTIAYNNKMSTTEFLIANHNISDETSLLYSGQEVVISYINPVITIVEQTHNVKKEATNFKTIEQKDSSLYEGTTKVIQSGQKGESKVTRKIEKQNGKITQALIVSTEVLKEPVNKIVKVGTKKAQTSSSSAIYTGPANVSGTWAWPTVSRYTITEYWGYGARTSIGEYYTRFHDGIDIAGLGCGTPIYAANGGTVIFAGWGSGYGYLVEISHGSGIVTFYGHLSSYSVSKGQTVSKGQRIGSMGNTGYSFGCHLHFGASRNGSSYNPLALYS